jgi:hypothetical protein
VRRQRLELATVMTTAAQELARVLGTAGISIVYGERLHALPVIEIPDPRAALLCAVAHRAVTGGCAVAHLGAGELVVLGPDSPLMGGFDWDPSGWRRGLPTSVLTVEDPGTLPELVPLLRDGTLGAGLTVRLRCDLGVPLRANSSPVSTSPVAWEEVDPNVVEEVAEAGRLAALVGPGVLRANAAASVRALAAAGDLGVLNTWGAKGIFDWHSRHHWATVGLQERDFELGGLQAADLTLVSGVDEQEAPCALWAKSPHRIVSPESLAALAESLGERPRAKLEMPPLRTALATVTQRAWSSSAVPLAPSLVTRNYADVLGHRGLVAADAGTGGFWVARTFPTTRLGTALVPPGRLPGWAAACVFVARLQAPLRPALGIVDGPLGEPSEVLLELGARRGIQIGLEVWDQAGDAISADAHLGRLSLLATGQLVVATLQTDTDQLGTFVDVAGPVRAWKDSQNP